ncbi:MAG TPA: class I SAM-dependent methyltransferase [Candidatus Scatomonas pullistercoris]|uniref:Class I SAM-dependent methyltransferase n=1 Tax=Candidatus Scatomonas pullistercoris TaxID=2840920 RepID=A0A9D1P2R2_9FIRM|nr:class I SAM-dependent methyltransferase [Candidatus Scatomonas pullistercoris]
MKISQYLNTDTVQGTMLLPLLSRARCAEKYPGFFRDPAARKAAGELEVPPMLRKMAEQAAPLYALRQEVLLLAVRRYLRSCPEAVIVNLGCGLDTSFSKADNGRCRWINLDLPGVMEVRRRLLPCGEREELLAADAEDLSWIETIGSRPCYVIAGGFFYYFPEARVRRLLCAMADSFPGGGVCFDCESPLALRLSQETARRAGSAEAPMYFSLKNPERQLRSWSRSFGGITCVDRLPGAFRNPAYLPAADRFRLRAELRTGLLKFVEIRFRGKRTGN